MRTIPEIQQEAAELCRQIGVLEVTKQRTVDQIDAQLTPLHQKVAALEVEARQVLAVQEEAKKQVQAAEAAKEAPAAEEVSQG